MMNKGLEVIEAHYLFGTSYDNIDIVVHPQSRAIVHSSIETADTYVIAQLGWPADMRLPLLYAVSGPARVSNFLEAIRPGRYRLADVQGTGLYDKYPCIPLGRKLSNHCPITYYVRVPDNSLNATVP